MDEIDEIPKAMRNKLVLSLLEIIGNQKKNKRIINEFSNMNNLKNHISNYHSINIPNTLSISSKSSISPTLTLKYRELLIPSITVSILYFINNYLWLVSLYYTIAAINNTIYQSQCIFVLIFSVFLLNKKLTIYNILSVISSIIGVALISFFGKEKENNSNIDPTYFGIILCLSASVIYALFQVKMNQIEKKYFDQNNEYNKFKHMLFFQFLMGFNILLLCWPGFIILDYFAIEIFVFPLNTTEWVSIMIITSLSFTYCITILIGITFSGALFMSIGTLLVIPFTYIMDIWLYNLIITPISIIGTVFVIIGFVLMQ